MIDDIVKALTIQISADDMTGGAWSSVTAGMKEAGKWSIALNQTWELGEKIYDKTFGTIIAGLERIAQAGEYNEARAGFEALSNSFGIDSGKMLASMNDVTEGLLGVEGATKAASNAIRMGFSIEQTETIWAFAKKFTDTVGGSFEDVATTIEKGLASGTAKSLKNLTKEFGITVEAGESMASAMAKIQARMDQMGAGAFNLGDAMMGVGKSFADMGLRIMAEANNVIGDLGFEPFAKRLRDIFWAIGDNAVPIASAFFGPFLTVGKQVMDNFGTLLGSIFGDSESVRKQILSLADFAGNALFVILDTVEAWWNGFYRIVSAPLTAWAKLMQSAMEATNIGGIYDNAIENFRKVESFLGAFILNRETLTLAQTKFNEKLLEYSQNAEVAKAASGSYSTGLQHVSQMLDGTTASAEKAEKAIAKTSAETEKAAKEAKLYFGPGVIAIGDQKNSEYADYFTQKAVGTMFTPHEPAGMYPSSVGRGAYTPQMGIDFGTTQGLVGGGAGAFGGLLAGVAGMNGGGIPSSSGSSRGAFKVDLVGVEPRLKEFLEYIVEQITNKAIAEGLITAGV